MQRCGAAAVRPVGGTRRRRKPGSLGATWAFGRHGFGQSPFGWGSRVAAYTPTAEVDGGTYVQSAGNLVSICAMPVYIYKSHEELRWEDYQLGDKGSQATSSAFGRQGFGQSPFGWGSRVAAYTLTAEVDGGTDAQAAGNLVSICAMPVYKYKSHEELRWEDYQLEDKGGLDPASQLASGFNFGATSTFGQMATNPFSSPVSSNPFTPKTPTFGSSGFGASSTPMFSSPFCASSLSLFGTTTSAATPSLFGAPSAPAFGASSSPSLFIASSTPSFVSSPSNFGSSQSATSLAFGSGLGFGNSQSSGLFQSSTPSFGQTKSAFGQTTPAFGPTNPFSMPSTGFGGNFFTRNSTPLLHSSSNPVGFGQTSASGAFSFGNFGQALPVASGGFYGVSYVFGQGNLGQSQGDVVMQPTPVTKPFGTFPAMPQMSINRGTSTPSVQYGISSIPEESRKLEGEKADLARNLASAIASRQQTQVLLQQSREAYAKVEAELEAARVAAATATSCSALVAKLQLGADAEAAREVARLKDENSALKSQMLEMMAERLRENQAQSEHLEKLRQEHAAALDAERAHRCGLCNHLRAEGVDFSSITLPAGSTSSASITIPWPPDHQSDPRCA